MTITKTAPKTYNNISVFPAHDGKGLRVTINVTVPPDTELPIAVSQAVQQLGAMMREDGHVKDIWHNHLDDWYAEQKDNTG